MKKHLLATAVAGLFAMPAVAQVSVSGNIDVHASRSNEVSQTAAGGTTPHSVVDQNNTGSGLGAGIDDASTTGWATSELIFQATEDLGGGLKATARFSQNISGNALGVQRDRYVDVAGGFGSVRLGRFNGFIGGYNNFSGAGTTAQGGELNTFTTGGGRLFGSGITGGNFERNSGQVQYTSPSFNGFTVSAAYADNSSDNKATANRLTESKMQSIGIEYKAGPLTVAFASGERKNKTAGVNAVKGRAFFFNGTVNGTFEQTNDPTANTTVGDAAGVISGFTKLTGIDPTNTSQSAVHNTITGIVTRAAAVEQGQLDATHDFDWMGVSYNLGPATIMASHALRKTASNTTAVNSAQGTLNDSKLTSIGLMVPLGATTLRASTYEGKDERGSATTDDVKLEGFQLSVTYSLSKRTYLYGVMGESDVKRDGSTSTDRKSVV